MHDISLMMQASHLLLIASRSLACDCLTRLKNVGRIRLSVVPIIRDVPVKKQIV